MSAIKVFSVDLKLRFNGCPVFYLPPEYLFYLWSKGENQVRTFQLLETKKTIKIGLKLKGEFTEFFSGKVFIIWTSSMAGSSSLLISNLSVFSLVLLFAF